MMQIMKFRVVETSTGGYKNWHAEFKEGLMGRWKPCTELEHWPEYQTFYCDPAARKTSCIQLVEHLKEAWKARVKAKRSTTKTVIKMI